MSHSRSASSSTDRHNATDENGRLGWPDQLNSRSEALRLAEHEQESVLLTSSAKISSNNSSYSKFTWSRRLAVLKWWIPELVASCLSVTCLVSTAVVLHYYNGHATADVTFPTGLTLNGIVAALSTLNRVCLMMPVSTALGQEAWLWFSAKHRRRYSCLGDLDLSDAASRGYWGSLVFLFSSRGQRLLACLGATITLLSLAFGTFIQQLINIENMPVTQPSSQFALGNLPRAEVWDNFTGSGVGNGVTPSLKMKAAIVNGMYTDSVVSVPSTCPSGTCTWPETPSLAVCGQCIASRYSTSCRQMSDLYPSWGTTCNYSMPSGSTFQVFSNTNQLGETVYLAFAAKSTSQGIHFNDNSTTRKYFARFDVFGAPYGVQYAKIWPKERWPNTSTTSSECALWACVKTYKTFVRSGQQYESVVSILDDIKLPWVVNNSTQFSVSYNAWFALDTYLPTILDGSATVFRKMPALLKPESIEAVWKGTVNLDRWIQNLATSMTNVLRTDIPMSRDMYHGTLYRQVYVVRWQWIILPAVVVLSSIVFWVIIMVQTARSPVQAWKCSPLALLLFDVDDEVKWSVEGKVEKYEGMKAAVAKRRVGLRKKQSGLWKFETYER